MSENAPTFAGLQVAAFESRRASEIAQLIQGYGGVATVAPSLREVSPQRNPAAVDFANRVLTGHVDAVIFMTGEGVVRLIEQVQRHVDRARFVTALSDIVTIARGPKPAAALAELGVRPAHVTTEPHTWREVLQVIDRCVPLANHTVGLQEYGEPNASLLAGLEARGATVINLKLYRWELPEDTAPLEACLRQIAAGKIDAVLFTSSHQVVNVLHLAQCAGIGGPVLPGFRSPIIGSIGPDTSATLRQNDLPVDVQPEHPTMQHLVEAVAAAAATLLAKKRWLTQAVPTVQSVDPVEAGQGH